MNRTFWIFAVLSGVVFSVAAVAEESGPVSAHYKALRCPTTSLGPTWAVLDRNGANAKVDPYLSSLGQGESGTGVITSPPFLVGVKKITFTICGHDGQAGGQGKNYVALVDARKGNELLKTPPPQNDALQEREWDVSKLQNVEVRVEAHDGDGGGAFAWLGIGRIDASDAFRIDFRQGMPKGWDQPQRKDDNIRYEAVAGGVPFKRDTNAFTLIPKSGSVEIPCGFTASRLFFLGCTVNSFKPLETYGGIEIHYRSGSPDVFPLMCGFTLDGTYKVASTSKATYLHVSGDPYQQYLVIKTRDAVIEKIRLVAEPDRCPVPRITAVTAETAAESECLMPLPDTRPDAAETTWIESHAISADSPDLAKVREEIRKAHKLPAESASSVRFQCHQIGKACRSEGVAAAYLDGDGQLDVAVGNVCRRGPN